MIILIIIKFILLLLLLILIFMLVNSFLWTFTKFRPFKKLFHDKLDWGDPDLNYIYMNGMNTKSKCKICGKNLCEDSQGNWFHI